MLSTLLVLGSTVCGFFVARKRNAWKESIGASIAVLILQAILVTEPNTPVGLTVAWLIFIVLIILLIKVQRKAEDTPSGSVVSFNYIDHEGKYSKRRIIPIACNRYHLVGYCFMRKEERTFRLDRISGYVICEKTGEMLDPASRSFQKQINDI